MKVTRYRVDLPDPRTDVDPAARGLVITTLPREHYTHNVLNYGLTGGLGISRLRDRVFASAENPGIKIAPKYGDTDIEKRFCMPGQLYPNGKSRSLQLRGEDSQWKMVEAVFGYRRLILRFLDIHGHEELMKLSGDGNIDLVFEVPGSGSEPPEVYEYHQANLGATRHPSYVVEMAGDAVRRIYEFGEESWCNAYTGRMERGKEFMVVTEFS